MLGDWDATAELAVEQSGQMCEPLGLAVMSAQKWNCAARKAALRNKARSLIRRELLSMYYLRRSLGGKGCGVKQRLSSQRQSVCSWQPTDILVRLRW
jgi:hypothetical protein